jgi:hypothetical protein
MLLMGSGFMAGHRVNSSGIWPTISTFLEKSGFRFDLRRLISTKMTSVVIFALTQKMNAKTVTSLINSRHMP